MIPIVAPSHSGSLLAVDRDQIMQIKQKFSQVANEDGFITLNEFEALLRRLPATQENPELIELYKKV